MKRFILIESDTQYRSLFAYELTETSIFNYKRKTEPIAVEIDAGKLFGGVRRVLVTADDIKDAAPIELAGELPRSINMEPVPIHAVCPPADEEEQGYVVPRG